MPSEMWIGALGDPRAVWRDRPLDMQAPGLRPHTARLALHSPSGPGCYGYTIVATAREGDPG
eukprot:5761089-Alexandrium_andersonii.AAC.1